MPASRSLSLPAADPSLSDRLLLADCTTTGRQQGPQAAESTLYKFPPLVSGVKHGCWIKSIAVVFLLPLVILHTELFKMEE